MKTFAAIVVATFVAGIGSASAQMGQGYYDARSYSEEGAYEDASPMSGPGPGVLSTGRSAYVGSARTDRTYGIGTDGQGRLAPHINGIF